MFRTPATHSRGMLVYEEDRKNMYGESRLDADFQADDIPQNCKLQVSDDKSSNMRLKEEPHDYPLEFTDAAKLSRIHPLPGGESIKILCQEETVKMDEITLSGSVSGIKYRYQQSAFGIRKACLPRIC